MRNIYTKMSCYFRDWHYLCCVKITQKLFTQGKPQKTIKQLDYESKFRKDIEEEN